jgi:transcriptional regulator with XRE-family HTH domain
MLETLAAVRPARTALGMTQVELARSAGVSLPTVQNIEGGRANPSLTTLEAVLGALGLGLGLEPRPADWDALAALGLPIAARRPRRLVPTEDLLVENVRLAALELARGGTLPGRERRTEALQALVAALGSHYPRLYARRLAASPPVRAIAARRVTGRTVKLGRMARAALAEYL